MEAQRGGLLRTDMAYSRRRLWVTHTWLSSSYHEEEEKKKQKNKRTCGKWYSHTHRISCTMAIEISLQMRQKHRKAFSLRLHWMNNWILQTVPITKSQLKSRLVAFMISLFLLLWIVFTLPYLFISVLVTACIYRLVLSVIPSVLSSLMKSFMFLCFLVSVHGAGSYLLCFSCLALPLPICLYLCLVCSTCFHFTWILDVLYWRAVENLKIT